MMQIVLVFLGGGLGSVGRLVTGQLAVRMFGPDFPYGTLIVNVTGSLLMGLLVGWLSARNGAGESEIRLFFATGVLGGFTTFSAFSLEAAKLWQSGALSNAIVYVLATVIVSLAAVFLGLWLARHLSV